MQAAALAAGGSAAGVRAEPRPEAFNALISLGYKPAEARRMLDEVDRSRDRPKIFCARSCSRPDDRGQCADEPPDRIISMPDSLMRRSIERAIRPGTPG